MLPDTPPTEPVPTTEAAPAPEEATMAAPEALQLAPPPASPAEEPAAADAGELAAGDEAAPTPASEAAPAQPAAPADLSPAACAARLAELFPALFDAGRALPIKLRIQADIQQRAPGVFSKKSLSIFLHRYTTSTAYIRALLQAPHRFDLDGAAAGEIAEEHRLAATTELERRRLIVEARRAAERDAQRQAAAAARRAQAAQAAPSATQAGTDGAEAPGPRAPRPPRPPRPQGPREPREPRPPRPPVAAPTPADASAPQGPAPAMVAPAAPSVAYSAAELDARRERASLLRAWEGSRLTRANFCVLKRIAESDLDAQLALARKEQGDRPAPPRPDTGTARPAQAPGGFRRDDRGGPPPRRGPGRPSR